MEKIVSMVDGNLVVVPDSLNLITPYVLQEQQDWFELEIRFVRRLLQPGERVIDIGANYGLFTLSMAKAIGPGGKIWAFEPAATTAGFLEKSVATNGYDNIVIDRRGVSSVAGTVRLSLNENAELNEIVRDNTGLSAGVTEAIEVASLDDLAAQYDWKSIDFLKLDAEGEEARIIEGGRGFLTANSPLIQYEVKAGASIHFDLIDQFKSIGYSSYRLVPGLNLLVPFDVGELNDAYLLNLYCCKADRAEILLNRGLLLPDASPTLGSEADRPHWTSVLAEQPYASALSGVWRQTVAEGRSECVTDAIVSHALAHRHNVPAAIRYRELKVAYIAMKALCDTEPSFLRLLTLSRIAIDFGARQVAVGALKQLIDRAFQSGRFDPAEPFLAASERFDALPVTQSLANWLMGSALEAFEQWAFFSSFYSGPEAYQRLKAIRDYGYASAEMLRRLELVARRFSMS